MRELDFQGRLDILLEMRLSGVANVRISVCSALRENKK